MCCTVYIEWELNHLITTPERDKTPDRFTTTKDLIGTVYDHKNNLGDQTLYECAFEIEFQKSRL